MKTIFSVVMLVIYGAMATFLSVIVLNIAGLPGALIAGPRGKRSKFTFFFGSFIALLGQSYVYLSFVAFIVNWTHLAAGRPDVIGFVIWPVAFLATLIPIWITMTRARVEMRESKSVSAQVEALHFTVVLALIGFFLFCFMPSILRGGWGWVPYVK